MTFGLQRSCARQLFCSAPLRSARRRCIARTAALGDSIEDQPHEARARVAIRPSDVLIAAPADDGLPGVPREPGPVVALFTRGSSARRHREAADPKDESSWIDEGMRVRTVDRDLGVRARDDGAARPARHDAIVLALLLRVARDPLRQRGIVRQRSRWSPGTLPQVVPRGVTVEHATRYTRGCAGDSRGPAGERPSAPSSNALAAHAREGGPCAA